MIEAKSRALFGREVPMLEAETVAKIRGLQAADWGTKRIARELGMRRNTVRRYSSARESQMGLTIAHFPQARTLEEFDFRFQPSIDQRLVKELATGRFLSLSKNVLIFGPPGVGKTHLAIGLGRAVVEAGHTVLFTSATALINGLSKAETKGKLTEQLSFLAKPKLLIVDELGYLPFERRSAHLFFQLVARRYERGSARTRYVAGPRCSRSAKLR